MEKITAENIINLYYYIALFATTFYIIKMALFAIFGGDVEVHTDFNGSFETDDSFDFLSIQSILAFFMGLGWMGLACMKVWGIGAILSTVISIVFGLALMFVSAYLMCCVKKLNKTVKKDMTKAEGSIAKAYTNFEPKGQGQVEISVNGQLSVEEAVNTSEEFIKSFDEVKVIKYENNKLYIEKE